jgi:N-acetylmuramoyl-L-alanine amidase
MRDIKKIIIHCSATKEGQDISVENIRYWHVEENGWSDIGYHFIVDINGFLHEGRDIDIQGAHTKGENKDSVGICYIGGLSEDMAWKDTRNKRQKDTLEIIIKYIKNLYPEAKVYGHNDFSEKDCPCFDAKEEYKHL